MKKRFCPTLDFDEQPGEGFVLRNIPAHLPSQAAQLVGEVRQFLPDMLVPILAETVSANTAGRFDAEARAWARWLGQDWRAVLAANCQYDLLSAALGCSTVALPTASGPVVARNMDWLMTDTIGRCSYLLRFHSNGGPGFCNAAWPGGVGVVTGLSGRGFAVVLNQVGSLERLHPSGYPVLLHLRRVVEDAAGFDEALTLLAHTELAAPALVTLIGSENAQRVVIERSPRRHALRFPDGDGPLVTTNDYRALKEASCNAAEELALTADERYCALMGTFGGHTAERNPEDEELLEVLDREPMNFGMTAQQVVIRPREGSIRVYVSA
jgi:hypothetical protein